MTAAAVRDSVSLTHAPTSRVTQRRFDIAFAASVALVVAVRWKAFARLGVPPGFDGGDWLALGRGLFGRSVRPDGVIAAPLAPLLTLGAVSLFGQQTSFVLLSAALSCAPGVGAYVVLRRVISSLPAVLLAMLLLVGSAAGEAASWGGYPQLIGLGLVPIAVYLTDVGLTSGRLPVLLGAGAALLAVALASDLVFAFGAAGAMTVGVLHLVQNRRTFKRVLKNAGTIALPVVVAVPLYVSLLRVRVSAITEPVRDVAPNAPPLGSRIEAVWFDAPMVWRALALAGLLALPLLWAQRRAGVWRIAAALLAPSVLAVLMWPETRLAYFLPTAVVFAAAVWSSSGAYGQSVAVRAFCAVALTMQVVVFPDTAALQARRYQALTPELVGGIAWLRSSSHPSAIVIVTPFRNAPPVAWWVEGLAERRTLAASSTVWVYFPVERENAAKAARVLSAGVPTPRTLEVARRNRADYVFLDKRWDEYATGRVTSLERAIPDVVAFENRGVVILRTGTSLSRGAR